MMPVMRILQRSYSTLICFFISFFLTCTITVSELDSNTETENALDHLNKKINSVLKTSILKNALIGIQIVLLNSGEVVYEHNPELALNPASNTKLITSAAALVKLTPQYRFQTRVYRKAKVSKGTLQGDLYLQGRGDPLLSYEVLLSLAQDVYTSGIRKITGDIVGDDSYFDDEREFSGWHDFSRSYSGKISALSLHKNSVRLLIKPASRSGVAPQVILDPPSSYIQLKNKAVTLSSNKVYASFVPSKDDEIATEETLLVLCSFNSM